MSSCRKLCGLAFASSSSSPYSFPGSLITPTDSKSTLALLASKRLDHVIAKQTVKCMKYENITESKCRSGAEVGEVKASKSKCRF
jgi:hypothetical protein